MEELMTCEDPYLVGFISLFETHYLCLCSGVRGKKQVN